MMNLDPSSLLCAVEEPEPYPVPGVESVVFESRLLSTFHRQSITMRAYVVIPDGARGRLPVIYMIAGFGASRAKVQERAQSIHAAMQSAPWNQFALVYLDGNTPAGHHVFVDSENTGPWESALVRELIPYLESRFPLSNQRFLTGHSSGGWAALWLQIMHPTLFQGVWATGPDPVDFRSFFTTDITPGSWDNFYRTRDGAQRVLWRDGGRAIITIEDFVRMQEASGNACGALTTFEWTFSPRDMYGPRPLFDRATGTLDPMTQRAWSRFDIRRVIESRAHLLRHVPIRIIVGEYDNFHLEDPAMRLCEVMHSAGLNAKCEIARERDHFDLYEVDLSNGLLLRIVQEMSNALPRYAMKRAGGPGAAVFEQPSIAHGGLVLGMGAALCAGLGAALYALTRPDASDALPQHVNYAVNASRVGYR